MQLGLFTGFGILGGGGGWIGGGGRADASSLGADRVEVLVEDFVLLGELLGTTSTPRGQQNIYAGE